MNVQTFAKKVGLNARTGCQDPKVKPRDDGSLLKSCKKSVGCKLLPVFLLAASLLGCTGNVHQQGDTNQETTATSAAEAEATRYLALAAQHESPERELYWLEAADKFIKLHRTKQASALLDQIEIERLPEAMQYLYLLVDAHLSLANRQPQQTLYALSRVRQSDIITEDAKIDLLQSRALALEQLGHPLDAAKTRINLAKLLDDKDMRAVNLQKIWRLLNAASVEELTAVANTDNQVLAGWVELSILAKEQSDKQDSFAAGLEQWSDKFPNHQANALFMPDEPEQASPAPTNHLASFPQRIAVLLPLSGKLQTTAEAFRDGFLATFYSSREANAADAQPVQIHFYDTEDDLLAVQQYRQAVEDANDLVVGPLTKQGLADLDALSRLPVPVLALNQLPNQASYKPPKHRNLFQLTLAPEDEIRQASLHAWANSHLNALVLSSDSKRGQRLATNFEKQWQNLGGEVVATELFPRKGDPSGALKSVLHIDDSNSRAKSVRQAIKRRFEFEPRRRDDFDVIFLAATPNQARRIKPLLAYYFAGKVPVYANSNIYSGYLDPHLDKDLEGTTFCDAPWVINPKFASSDLAKTIKSLWPNSKAYTRLHGLGVDAYQIIHYLPRLQQYSQLVYKGASGDLSLASNLQFRRELPCAKFGNNKIELLKDIPISAAMLKQPGFSS